MLGVAAASKVGPEDGPAQEEKGCVSWSAPAASACSERLQAEDDEGLFEQVREHMDQEYPEKGIEDEHVHNLIEATAHDNAEDTERRP